MIISLAVLLFVVMDPFGNLVIVNSLLSGVPRKERPKIILRESLIAMLLLIGAVFAGRGILSVLGLENYSLSISGGIVLFIIALGMLFPSRSVVDESPDGAPFIVPIAMPMIAGPSTLSMVILFSQEHASGIVVSAVLLSSLASALLLTGSSRIFDFLGHRGSVALERLMGMLLIMISVQMVLDGLKSYLGSGG